MIRQILCSYHTSTFGISLTPSCRLSKLFFIFALYLPFLFLSTLGFAKSDRPVRSSYTALAASILPLQSGGLFFGFPVLTSSYFSLSGTRQVSIWGPGEMSDATFGLESFLFDGSFFTFGGLSYVSQVVGYQYESSWRAERSDIAASMGIGNRWHIGDTYFYGFRWLSLYSQIKETRPWKFQDPEFLNGRTSNDYEKWKKEVKSTRPGGAHLLTLEVGMHFG